MNKAGLIVLASSMSLLSYAQKMKPMEIPEAVKSNFQKQYPAVTDVKWEKEGENYEVEFEQNKSELSLVYDAKGNLLETEVEIKTDQLPKAVSQYVETNYKGQKIKEASKITDAKGVVSYEAEVKDMDLIFDSNGSFIKVEKDEHDEKDEKD